ncbi:hypothetical protein ZWY2020_034538 [Hordeum vulgare]|nr:hypothetical protein ZWY2020_034538 [Hordeum vulgare]
MADVDVETEWPRARNRRRGRSASSATAAWISIPSLDMSTDDLVQMFPARARRRFKRSQEEARACKEAAQGGELLKKDAPAGEKPEPVRTHLRNMIIVPEMIGSLIGVYNGKTFNQVEIKPEMISHYLAEFSISYKPVSMVGPVSVPPLLQLFLLNEFAPYFERTQCDPPDGSFSCLLVLNQSYILYLVCLAITLLCTMSCSTICCENLVSLVKVHLIHAVFVVSVTFYYLCLACHHQQNGSLIEKGFLCLALCLCFVISY